MRTMLFTFTLCLFIQLSHGQVADSIGKAFITHTFGKLDYSQFKDSTALYTCRLQLIVFKDQKKTMQLSSNDTTISNQIKGLEVIKSFDFRRLIGKNNRVAFHIPVAVIVWGSKSTHQMIDAITIDNRINQLFYFQSSERDKIPTIQMSPLVISLDKKVYD